MKKTAFFILMLTAVAAQVFAETKVKSSIEKNESWTPKLSPYIIDGTVTVETKAFLTIYPGTEVKFKEGAKLVVKGSLYARGDRLNPVRLLPFDGESFYEGIVFQSRHKNTMEYCVMIRGAIASEGTPLILSNNYILNSTGVLLKVFADALITGNYFYNNTYGVYVEGKNAKFALQGNTFNRNRFAVYLKEMMKDGGIIKGNNFFENKISVTNYTADSVQARDNYWGAVEDQEIGGKIFEKKNNPRAGEVVFRPYAKAKLKLEDPPAAFVSLVKIYLGLKRPDEEPMKFSFGTGADFLYILSPAWAADEFDIGYGMRAEFTFNITADMKAGIETEITGGAGAANGVYDFNFSLTQFLASYYYYIGYKKNIYFVPYLKAGMGIGLISAEKKSITGLPVPELGGRASWKYNEANYAIFGGLGAELFITRYLSIKAEALYNSTTDRSGTIMFPMANVTACVYFDTPFFLNQK